MKKCNIYFIRHGETYLNKYHRMQGWSDAPLTPAGEKVAEETGRRLQDISFDAVYASDLGRTIRTAECIMKENRKNKVEIRPVREFRETFFGYFEGSQGEAYDRISENVGIPKSQLFQKMTLEELMDATKEADPEKDAENAAQVAERLDRGMRDLLTEIKEKEYANVLVVTHGNVIRNIVAKYDSQINVFCEIGNSSITVLEYDGKGVKVTKFNQ